MQTFWLFMIILGVWYVQSPGSLEPCTGTDTEFFFLRGERGIFLVLLVLVYVSMSDAIVMLQSWQTLVSGKNHNGDKVGGRGVPCRKKFSFLGEENGHNDGFSAPMYIVIYIARFQVHKHPSTLPILRWTGVCCYLVHLERKNRPHLRVVVILRVSNLTCDTREVTSTSHFLCAHSKTHSQNYSKSWLYLQLHVNCRRYILTEHC